MTAPLFLVDPGDLDGLAADDVVDLTGPEAHHAAAVVRLAVGEHVLVADRQGARVLTEVTEVARELVRLRVLERADDGDLLDGLDSPRTKRVLLQGFGELAEARQAPVDGADAEVEDHADLDAVGALHRATRPSRGLLLVFGGNAEDADWRRNGDDVETTLSIALDEAVLGGKVEAETIEGPVMISIPRGASTGQKLRLKGRGLKGEGGKHGDQHVVLKIVMPPRIDDDLARFMQEWRQNHGYDPRRGK